MERRGPFIAVLVAALVLGALVGLFGGRSIASSQADDNEHAAELASDSEDELRDRRDLLEARLTLVQTQTKPLKKVVTSAPLLATNSTAEVKLGTEFSVDGASYVISGVRVVDSFTSKDPKRPAPEQKGSRWLLVDTTFRNRDKEGAYPSCGTVQSVRVVLEDGTTVAEVRDKPPVHPETYDLCGFPIQPGKTGRWIAPVRVPEGATVAGIHVADVYARTSDTPFNVQSGKAAWLPFDEPVEIGKVGDEEISMDFGPEPT